MEDTTHQVRSAYAKEREIWKGRRLCFTFEGVFKATSSENERGDDGVQDNGRRLGDGTHNEELEGYEGRVERAADIISSGERLLPGTLAVANHPVGAAIAYDAGSGSMPH